MWFHLGPAGDMRGLPPVESRDQSVDVDTNAPVAEHQSLSGARTQDRMGVHRSVWQLPWPYLTVAEVADLERMRRGLLGGSLWLIDPLEPNLAPAAVATCGTEGKSPTGWASESGSRTWLRVGLDRAPDTDNVGVIVWSRSTIADTLSIGRETPDQRVPLLGDGGQVVAAARLRRTSDDPVALAPVLDFFDLDGARTTLTGPTVTLTGTGWVQVVLVAAPPAGAVTVDPAWSIAAGEPASTVQINAVALGYGTTPPPYSPGGGAARVFIRALAKTYDDDETITAKLTVVES